MVARPRKQPQGTRPMTRTQELEAKGYRPVGRRRTPFLLYPPQEGPDRDEHIWIEGTIDDVWERDHGPNITTVVEGHSEGLKAGIGSRQGPNFAALLVKVGDTVNVGIGFGAIKQACEVLFENREACLGERYHLACEGWGEGNNGQPYRELKFIPVTDGLVSVMGQPGHDGETLELLKPDAPDEGGDALPF